MYEFLSAEQRKIFWIMLIFWRITKQLMNSIDFHSRKNTLEVNGEQLFGYQHSSKYLLVCSAEDRNSR